jgi:alkylated DNA repair dioxygenase AlkB
MKLFCLCRNGKHNTFLDDLGTLGVKVELDANGVAKANLQGSDIQGDRQAQRVLNMVLERLSTVKEPDAYGIHTAKRFIDTQVDFGKRNLANLDRIVKYRGKHFITETFPDWLQTLRDMIAEKTGFHANASIMNFYPDGSDHITWHADDEKFLEEKTVASISFCSERVFSMRNSENRFDITLRDGSLLMMYDAIEHCLESQKSSRGRFNITFRKLNSEKGMGNYYYYNRGLENAVDK